MSGTAETGERERVENPHEASQRALAMKKRRRRRRCAADMYVGSRHLEGHVDSYSSLSFLSGVLSSSLCVDLFCMQRRQRLLSSTTLSWRLI